MKKTGVEVIIKELEEIYYGQKEYLKAFELKQERQRIEQQFGFIAFIGANTLGSRKANINLCDEIYYIFSIFHDLLQGCFFQLHFFLAHLLKSLSHVVEIHPRPRIATGLVALIMGFGRK